MSDGSLSIDERARAALVRAEAATPGPPAWAVRVGPVWRTMAQCDRDAAFIAATRPDIMALACAVLERGERIRALEEISNEGVDIERRTLCDVLDRLGADGVSAALDGADTEQLGRAIFRFVADLEEQAREQGRKVGDAKVGEIDAVLCQTLLERDAARAELARLRPVVEAAEAWYGAPVGWYEEANDALDAAIEAYREPTT